MKLHHAHKPTTYSAPRIDESTKTGTFKRILGVHVNGHDASVSVVENGQLVELIEFERVMREKHCRINVLHPRFESLISWLFDDYQLDPKFDAVAVHLHSFGSEPREYEALVQDKVVEVLSSYIPGAHFLQLNHHLCHAASSYFSSPFNESVILSVDGHGNEGSTIGFVAKGNEIKYIKGWPFSLGRAYSALGNIIGGIESKDGNSAGKVMGLTSYGKTVPEWKEAIRSFITSYTGIRSEFSPLFWEAPIADGVFKLPGFGTIHGKSAFEGPDDPLAQNFAATFQEVWSEVVQDMISEIIAQTGISNVCIVGGCALNATTNYDVLRMPEVTNVHLIPHPNDEGISAGAALYTYYGYQGQAWHGQENPYMSPYLGVPILDIEDMDKYVGTHNGELLEEPTDKLAALLLEGNTIALMQGRSEIGPRALGNRSILADPRVADMKDRINDTIKHREWYRPFAPVVREGQQDKYFHMPTSAPYMSYIALVRPEWEKKLPAIVHADGTARVQTVTQAQNPFLWDLLGKFEALTGVGVLLNTSLNGRGEPIYSRVSEGLNLLATSELDYLYVDGYIFNKHD